MLNIIYTKANIETIQNLSNATATIQYLKSFSDIQTFGLSVAANNIKKSNHSVIFPTLIKAVKLKTNSESQLMPISNIDWLHSSNKKLDNNVEIPMIVFEIDNTTTTTFVQDVKALFLMHFAETRTINVFTLKTLFCACGLNYEQFVFVTTLFGCSPIKFNNQEPVSLIDFEEKMKAIEFILDTNKFGIIQNFTQMIIENFALAKHSSEISDNIPQDIIYSLLMDKTILLSSIARYLSLNNETVFNETLNVFSQFNQNEHSDFFEQISLSLINVLKEINKKINRKFKQNTEQEQIINTRVFVLNNL